MQSMEPTFDLRRWVAEDGSEAFSCPHADPQKPGHLWTLLPWLAYHAEPEDRPPVLVVCADCLMAGPLFKRVELDDLPPGALARLADVWNDNDEDESGDGRD